MEGMGEEGGRYHPWRRLWRLTVYSRVTTSSLRGPGARFFSDISDRRLSPFSSLAFDGGCGERR
jgi:hypothetical protein